MPEDLEYWVAFNHVRGVGSARVQKMLAKFGNLADAWTAPRAHLLQAGLDARTVEAVCSERGRIDPQGLLRSCQKLGLRILCWDDAEYPKRLKELPAPPPVLYMRGKLDARDDYAVAVVGTRRPTAYGKEVTRWLTDALAANGITVVSGLARGVDAEAHTAALNKQGRTLAVLGNGADIVYPPEHKKLADRIVETGAILSDYPPGTPPDAANFPPRNRIIAGMALATIVVEAGEESGALLTAHYAAEYGREVFAVPGSVLSPMSRGCNRLIGEGAHPALSPEEILSVLDLVHADTFVQARFVIPDGPVEAKILAVLGQEPMHIDLVRANVDLPVEEVSSTLALMELKGTVRQVGGMHYVAARGMVAGLSDV